MPLYSYAAFILTGFTSFGKSPNIARCLYKESPILPCTVSNHSGLRSCDQSQSSGRTARPDEHFWSRCFIAAKAQLSW